MPDLTTPAPDTAGVIAPPPLIYAIPLAFGLLLHHWFPRHLLAGGTGRVLGWLCIALGMIGIPAIVAFARAKTRPEPWKPTTALVTTGPYGITRNPMYLGFTLLYAGVTLLVNTVWPVLFVPIILPMMQLGVIHREEAYLERKFGDQYRAYRAQVRRWI
jgi:protein-S-isoprenylcysteine O-methyltransferase Ste14